MDVNKSIEIQLDSIANEILNQDKEYISMDELQGILSLRLKHAQSEYYRAVAKAMNAAEEAQDTNKDTAAKELYEKYMLEKTAYRESKAPESKAALSAALKAYLSELAGRLAEAYRDSDCQEERELIHGFVAKLHKI